METKKIQETYEISNGPKATPFATIIWSSGLGCYLKDNIELLTIKKLKEITTQMEKIEKEVKK